MRYCSGCGNPTTAGCRPGCRGVNTRTHLNCPFLPIGEKAYMKTVEVPLPHRVGNFRLTMVDAPGDEGTIPVYQEVEAHAFANSMATEKSYLDGRILLQSYTSYLIRAGDPADYEAEVKNYEVVLDGERVQRFLYMDIGSHNKDVALAFARGMNLALMRSASE